MLFHFIGNLLTNRPARKRSLTELIAQLETTGQEAGKRIAEARDTAKNRKILGHVTGIERWGQRRLQVALGEPFVLDESDAYCPSEDSSLDDLREAFAATRRKTVSLARDLESANVDPETRIRHNQWGELTVKGWLHYLHEHAKKDIQKTSR